MGCVSRSEYEDLESRAGSLEQDLSDSEITIDSLRVTIREKDNALNQALERNEELNDDRLQLDEKVVELENSLSVAQGELEGQKGESGQLSILLDEARKDLAELETSNSGLEGRLASLEGQLASLEALGQQEEALNLSLSQQQDALDALREEATTQQAQIEALQSQQSNEEAELDKLASQRASLEEDIAGLEAKISLAEERLNTYNDQIWVNNVACSASMEPRIGCTDRIVIDTDVDPEDIEIGHVILTPASSRDCEAKRGSVLHRVTRVTRLFGEEGWYHTFATKGDNNRYEDPCRFHEDAVYGRLAAVEEDVYPQMEEYRLRVILALEEFRAEVIAYQTLVDETEGAIQDFVERRDRNCIYSSADGVYYCYDVLKVRNLLGEAQRLWKEFQTKEPSYWEDIDVAWEAYLDILEESRDYFREVYG